MTRPHPVPTAATVTPLEADVVIEDERWRTHLPDLDILSAAVAALVASCPKGLDAPSAATVLLSNDAHISALNARFRGQPQPTNVLSFPAAPDTSGPEDPIYLGDIIIALDTVVREAEAAGISVADHARHLTVHGLLHLLGYDHLIDADATEMETLETHILARLGVADPYAAADAI